MLFSKAQISVCLGALLCGTSSARIPKVIERCYTARTTTSISPVPTTTISTTVTIFVSEKATTVTASTTITPSVITSTYTDSKLSTITITASQITDTYVSTSTQTSTTVITEPTPTSTITSTISSTTVVSSGTTTIAAPSGFLPALDTMADASEERRKKLRRETLNKQVNPAVNKAPLGLPNLLAKTTTKSYPADVTCLVTTDIYTTTYAKTVTAKKPTTTITGSTPTTTTTSTSTVYTTSTVMLTDVSSTTTVFTTITASSYTTPPTTTTTTTTTTISTSIVPAATEFAACGPENIIGSKYNHSIYSASESSYPKYDLTSDSSAQDCCVSCFMDPICGGFAFYGGTTSNPGQRCYVFDQNGNSCDYPGEYVNVAATDSGPPDAGYFVGNGLCGAFQ